MEAARPLCQAENSPQQQHQQPYSSPLAIAAFVDSLFTGGVVKIIAKSGIAGAMNDDLGRSPTKKAEVSTPGDTDDRQDHWLLVQIVGENANTRPIILAHRN